MDHSSLALFDPRCPTLAAIENVKAKLDYHVTEKFHALLINQNQKLSFCWQCAHFLLSPSS